MRSTTLRRLAQRLAPFLNDAACTPLLSGGCARSPAAGQRSLPLLDCHAHAGTQSAHLAGCALSFEHDLRDDRHTQFAQRPVVLVQLGHPWSAGQSAGALAAPLDGCACPVARSREDKQPHAAQVQAHVEQLGGLWSAGRSARALAAVLPDAHGGADAHTLAQAGLGSVRGFSATSHTDCRGLAVGAPVQDQAPASREAQQSTASTGTLQSGTVHADTGPAGHEKGNALPAAQADGLAAERLAARNAWVNLPNAISAARALSGPGVAWLILEGHHGAALAALAVAGASDWADGYVAKRWGQASVVGSYLDPAADKVLVGCTVAALAYEGALPMWLAGLILGRDVLLVGGAFVHRYRTLGWRARGWAEFYRILPADPGTAGPSITGPSSMAAPAGQPGARVAGREFLGEAVAAGSPGPEAGVSRTGSAPPAPLVRPLMVSKVNTVLQLGLIASCIVRSWYGWPPEEAVWALGAATGITTVASCAAYVRAYLNGTLLK